ncbi:hypothetical protein L208DRAFT_1463810 [Tricholoma matsutake]|nr:hypothetical protein L208DRAFT_1463810 [Tricholoma matsutake 945]
MSSASHSHSTTTTYSDPGRTPEYQVQAILDSRLRRGKLQYSLHHNGYGYQENSCVKESHVNAPTNSIKEFHRWHTMLHHVPFKSPTLVVCHFECNGAMHLTVRGLRGCPVCFSYFLCSSHIFPHLISFYSSFSMIFPDFITNFPLLSCLYMLTLLYLEAEYPFRHIPLGMMSFGGLDPPISAFFYF